jgi:hypothetical protein
LLWRWWRDVTDDDYARAARVAGAVWATAATAASIHSAIMVIVVDSKSFAITAAANAA